MACGFQKSGNGISQNSLASMADGERSGGIGTDKFNQHLFILPCLRKAVTVSLLTDRFND
jgi:hypothetical protein